MKKYLIIGNWKNNPGTLKEAVNNFKIIKARKNNSKQIEIVVCPAIIHLAHLSNGYRGQNIKFGGQNFYLNDETSHTGETTLAQLKDLKAQYVIVGHAERRKIGETCELVALKLKDAIHEGLTPVLCIGEEIRDSGGEYLKILEEQLVRSLDNISEKEIKKITIAYEPLWAIGSNLSVSPADMHIVNILIKKMLTSLYDRKLAFSIPILYGGSVDEGNCNELLKGGDINGLLIGRASSNPHSFIEILKKVDQIL